MWSLEAPGHAVTYLTLSCPENRNDNPLEPLRDHWLREAGCVHADTSGSQESHGVGTPAPHAAGRSLHPGCLWRCQGQDTCIGDPSHSWGSRPAG